MAGSIVPGNATLQTINDRRSTRMFLDTPVSEDDIRTILDAAHQAPSAHNQQSWRFIVISGAQKDAFAALINDKAADFPKPSSTLLRLASRAVNSAPVVVGIANSGELISRGAGLFNLDDSAAFDFFRVMEIQSSAAAVQNLLLAATSLGLSTVWLGVLVLIKADILKFIGEPQGEFMAVIPVGYSVPSTSGPKKKALDMVIRRLA
ncbi:MAG: nitroreductase family protein [Candidatus Omnitrophica bacterium]|nr:nitroreductase family protein [Candidatus Omnitrophota bacterium]